MHTEVSDIVWEGLNEWQNMLQRIGFPLAHFSAFLTILLITLNSFIYFDLIITD